MNISAGQTFESLRHPKAAQSSAASLSLSAGRSDHRGARRRIRHRHQERHRQRTAVSGPFSRPPDHARRVADRRHGADGGRALRRRAGRQGQAGGRLFDDGRQGEVQEAGGPRRSGRVPHGADSPSAAICGGTAARPRSTARLPAKQRFRRCWWRNDENVASPSGRFAHRAARHSRQRLRRAGRAAWRGRRDRPVLPCRPAGCSGRRRSAALACQRCRRDAALAPARAYSPSLRSAISRRTSNIAAKRSTLQYRRRLPHPRRRDDESRHRRRRLATRSSARAAPSSPTLMSAMIASSATTSSCRAM